jgi:hypothetical protein
MYLSQVPDSPDRADVEARIATLVETIERQRQATPESPAASADPAAPARARPC